MNQQSIAAQQARHTVDRSRGAITVALHRSSVTTVASHRARAGCDAYSARNPLQLSSAVAGQRSPTVMRISEVHGRVAAHATSAVADYMRPQSRRISESGITCAAVAERIRPQSRRISESVLQLYIVGRTSSTGHIGSTAALVRRAGHKQLRCCFHCCLCDVHVCVCVSLCACMCVCV